MHPQLFPSHAERADLPSTTPPSLLPYQLCMYVLSFTFFLFRYLVTPRLFFLIYFDQCCCVKFHGCTHDTPSPIRSSFVVSVELELFFNDNSTRLKLVCWSMSLIDQMCKYLCRSYMWSIGRFGNNNNNNNSSKQLNKLKTRNCEIMKKEFINN